mgnify:CR=1 FL=1
MTASPFDSLMLREHLSDPQAARLFTDAAEIRAMLLAEGALARAQGFVRHAPKDVLHPLKDCRDATSAHEGKRHYRRANAAVSSARAVPQANRGSVENRQKMGDLILANAPSVMPDGTHSAARPSVAAAST